jgi:hypothetical protein
MWTINDFSIYEMVTGWSTHKKLVYPHCMENNKAINLMNDGKAFFFIVTGSSCQVVIDTEKLERNF